MSETWKEITEFKGYDVSSLGRVRCRRPRNINSKPPKEPRILKHFFRYGYPTVCLRNSIVKKSESIHILVAKYFIGERPSKEHQVNHKNFIKTDNRLENLEYVSIRDNTIHKRISLGNKNFGVHKSRSLKNPYIAQLRHNGDTVLYQYCPTIEKAMEVYDMKVKELGIGGKYERP